ncbi:roadblock/LC7 domain-containing protein [Olleya aquimaris]|uniref:Roadblock/LC7 domain-containing protein n=1 Tax=Olleya sediminilitoris TaxID=2795739 RepID=A0ABS1WL43_9FLAO|nr:MULTISPECIES: roadblock/LC7 domain-containing protein [Olleya]AXO81729.1 roadblock/LC7 domain-containing protein [Olleya aquimaris]MBL7559832.1 roadblock/LC7 domain-containing protein [Olleya sediminilitoris]
MINLQQLLQDTGAITAILADKDGNVIDSINTEHSNNLALMTETSFAMCNDLLKDITGSNLNQLIARSEENFVVVNKLDSDNLILLASDNISRFGLLLKQMNSLNINK